MMSEIIPFAYIEMIFSSIPETSFLGFGTTLGSKALCRSCGTLIWNSPYLLADGLLFGTVPGIRFFRTLVFSVTEMVIHLGFHHLFDRPGKQVLQCFLDIVRILGSFRVPTGPRKKHVLCTYLGASDMLFDFCYLLYRAGRLGLNPAWLCNFNIPLQSFNILLPQHDPETNCGSDQNDGP